VPARWILAAVASVFGVGRASDLADRFRGAPTLFMVDGVEVVVRGRGDSLVVRAGGTLRWSRPAPRWSFRRASGTGRPLAAAGRPPPPSPSWPRTRRRTILPAGRGTPEPVADSQVAAPVALVRRLVGCCSRWSSAACGRVLDPGELLDRYGDRLLDSTCRAPTRPPPAYRGRRQYRPLEPDARYALRQLSVFRGRWSVGLAEDLLVAVDDPAVLDRLVGWAGDRARRGPVPVPGARGGTRVR
jgi:hypothetical protein